ncbi:MAG: S9 family peptidase [Bacteroidales bacterium]|nr:S9 family peptidase [Bacteroidales bacterium]
MKTRLFLLSLVFVMLASCKAPDNQKKEDAPLIGKKELKLDSDKLTAELMWEFGRVGDIQTNTDESLVLFGVSWYDVQQNKGNRELYTMKPDGSDQKQITSTAGGEYDARFTPEGKITFMASAEKGIQVWEMNADGTNRRQLTNIEGGINGYIFSPDFSKLLYAANVAAEKPEQNLFEGLDKTSGRLMNDMMYRHWDQWVDTYSHIFVANYDGNGLGEATDIMKGEQWESPVAPFGGMEQITWAPDNKSIVYTCRKKKGKEYTLSTNTDLYQYDLNTSVTKNLTEGMMGYDMNPVFSPNGSLLIFTSMARDGYEADQLELYSLILADGSRTNLTASFDQDVNQPQWSKDGKIIYFISNAQGTEELHSYSTETKEFKKITEGVHDYTSFTLIGNKVLATMTSMSKPAEIYSVNLSDGLDTEISFINKSLLDQLNLGTVTKRWIKTTDNKKMLTWVILPPNFDSTKTYPTLLYCQGGPQSTVSQFWSYRWNFQMMAANDYVIVAPNRRGVPGFGQAWNEQISGDYCGQNMKDYLAAIDEVAKEPWADETRMGAVGASYGGFSVYWLAGNHNKRFKAFIAHDGMFNLEAQYLETEEMWFANWDLGGSFWDKNNAVAQRSFANSPHKFVQNWDTPILIIHSELDYRIVASQGMQAFNAAQLKGIPSEYLYFPDENHWILKPQNSVLWQRVFYHWLDKWLK